MTKRKAPRSSERTAGQPASEHDDRLINDAVSPPAKKRKAGMRPNSKDVPSSPQRTAKASSTPLYTPQKPRSNHTQSRSNRIASMDGLAEERRAEMRTLYKGRHEENDSILNITRLDSQLEALAVKITTWTAKNMERLLGTAASSTLSAEGSISGRTRSRVARAASTSLSGASTKSAGSDGAGLARDISGLGISPKPAARLDNDDAALVANIEKLRKWTSTKGDFSGSEREMYGPISAFVAFVARCVQMHLLDSATISEEAAKECRLILPGSDADYQPSDSDDRTRIDLGLISSLVGDPIALYPRVDYYRLRAVLEAKRSKSENEDASAQLYEYTRQIFSQQHNLRFAWGLTACAADVRVCHFGPDKAVASEPMDVATSEGRRAFIRLLVAWSLCDDSQLGRDPTMGYMRDKGCWWIDCSDDGYDGGDIGSTGTSTSNDSAGARSSKMERYYFNTTICLADRLFGRHTRCFPATKDCPAEKIPSGESLKATVVIKDAWAYAKREASEDSRDEVRSMKKIQATFKAKNRQDILYPKIEVGGRVKIKRRGELVEDTTLTIYDGCDSALLDVVASDILFRAHRRIAMSTIGEPLRKVRNVKEFVTVLHDAMQCHYTIVKHCRILHRDISENNVLVVRQEDGAVRGLLIDFDCAINIDEEKTGARGEMTGTYPFMSLNNLSRSEVKRTSLDDWESMLYLLCLYATVGLEKGNERSREELAELPIARWRKDDIGSVKLAKQGHLSSADVFEEQIVRHFNDKDRFVEQLRALATLLYMTLFENEDAGPLCYGTSKHTSGSSAGSKQAMRAKLSSKVPPPMLAGSTSSNSSDPFEMRAQQWELISRQLLEAMTIAKSGMDTWEDIAT